VNKSPSRSPSRRLTAAAVWYIAAETVRRYGEPEPHLAQKLRRNVRRNLGLLPSEAQVQRLILRYKGLYNHVASVLSRHIHAPPRAKYVDWKDVDIPAVENEFRTRSPRESKQIVRMLTYYVIHYEYLR